MRMENEYNVDEKNPALKFIDAIDTPQHILLFYSDPKYAKRIEFQFIKNGLVRGEHCIYATEEDPSFIKEKMEDYGISVESFLRKNLLHVYQTVDPFSHPDGVLAGARSNLEMILKDARPPFNVVSMIIPDTGTVEAMNAHLSIEKEFHNAFHSFDGSVICPYDIKKMERSKSDGWIKSLFDSHHSAIYAPRQQQGGVFRMS